MRSFLTKNHHDFLRKTIRFLKNIFSNYKKLRVRNHGFKVPNAHVLPEDNSPSVALIAQSVEKEHLKTRHIKTKLKTFLLLRYDSPSPEQPPEA